MPFAHVRARLHFRGPGFTFSESFYRTSAVVDASQLALADQLANKRVACLCSAIDLHSYSVSAVEQRRISQSRRKNNGGGFLKVPKDVTNSVINVTLLAGVYSRNYAVHGNPDSDTVFNATSGQDVTVASAELKSFMDYLTLPANGWGMRVETKRAGDPGNPIITGITLGAGGVAFAVAGLAVVPGDKIKVSGCKGFLAKQFNGNWRIISYVAGVATCLTTRKIDPRFVYIGSSGQVRVVDDAFYSYPGFTGWDPNTAESGTKKTSAKKK